MLFQVGSCFAHEVYPTIQLPDPVALFLEESGYFVCPKMGPSGNDAPQQKTQRVLHMNVLQESRAWKSITAVYHRCLLSFPNRIIYNPNSWHLTSAQQQKPSNYQKITLSCFVQDSFSVSF